MDADQAMGIQFKDDITMEILSRLPVQYLIRFKCASKSWKALISDPYFIKKHLNHVKNDRNSHKLLFYERSNMSHNFYCCPLSSIENVQKLDFSLSTRSTIYCVYNGLAIIHDNTIRSKLLLWNPSTRESILLPDPEFPPLCNGHLGFGYDSTSDDYKILKIHSGIQGSKVASEILALKSGSWRNIDNHPCGICSQFSDVCSELAFVNDAFHWMGSTGNNFGISSTHSLVSFSISNEVYEEIPLPEEILHLKDYLLTGVSALDGMLCVYSTYSHHGSRTFKLWVLNDYGVKESWNASFVINDVKIVKAIPKYRFADGEVLFWCAHLLSTSLHSFRTSKGPFGLCDAAWDGFSFTDSLISPKSLI